MSKDRDLTSLRQELDNFQNLNASFREQLERSHKENSILTDDNAFLRRKISSFQQEINNNHNECVRLESELYQQGQEVERLKKENVGFLKNKREVERKLREETQAFEKDRIVWQERESELYDQAKALQETITLLAQQNEQAKNEYSPPESPTLGPNSHYIAIREAKTAQRTIKELEKRNSELTAEVDKAKQATTESTNLNKNHVRSIQHLENELSQVKHMHQSLMEENEAFQLLLHEKTMKGEFVLNPIMQRSDSYSEKKNTDIIEKVTNGDVSSSPKEADNLDIFKDSYLAAELNRASVLSTSLLGERVHKESDHTIIENKLQEEIKSLKNANKSMRLYIEKILNRILETQGFEELLSSEWVKPPASPVTPVTGSFSFNNTNNNSNNKPAQEENKAKKLERRKTLSGWHFRSTSQPQNNFTNDKIITEEPDQVHPLRKSNDGTVPSLSDAPKRPQRRNSSSGTKNTKRFSLFNWGSVKEEEKKDDPYMRPIILVQEKERKE